MKYFASWLPNPWLPKLWSQVVAAPAVWGLRKQLTRNCRATGDEAMLFVIIITNPLRKQNNVWVGCTERLKFQPALELHSFDSKLFVLRSPEDTQSLSLSRPFPSWTPTQPLEGMPSSEADNPSPNKPFLPFFSSLSRPGSVVSCPIVLHYHIKSWHGTKQLNVLKECSSICSNPCQLCFPELLPWILGEVWSIKASHFHIYLVSCYTTRRKPPVCRIKEQAWFPEVFLLDHQCLPAARGMAYPQFSLSRDLKSVKELQGLNPPPVPIVSDSRMGSPVWTWMVCRNFTHVSTGISIPIKSWERSTLEDLFFRPVSPINISLLL